MADMTPMEKKMVPKPAAGAPAAPAKKPLLGGSESAVDIRKKLEQERLAAARQKTGEEVEIADLSGDIGLSSSVTLEPIPGEEPPITVLPKPAAPAAGESELDITLTPDERDTPDSKATKNLQAKRPEPKEAAVKKEVGPPPQEAAARKLNEAFNNPAVAVAFQPNTVAGKGKYEITLPEGFPKEALLAALKTIGVKDDDVPKIPMHTNARKMIAPISAMQAFLAAEYTPAVFEHSTSLPPGLRGKKSVTDILRDPKALIVAIRNTIIPMSEQLCDKEGKPLEGAVVTTQPPEYMARTDFEEARITPHKREDGKVDGFIIEGFFATEPKDIFPPDAQKQVKAIGPKTLTLPESFVHRLFNIGQSAKAVG